MAITLIKETGAIVPNANTYTDLAEAVSYAAQRGVTLTEDDATAIKLIKAMDYLEGLSYKGSRVSPGIQPLAWPRKNVLIDDYAQPENAIPILLIKAQCQLVIEIANGVDINPTISGAFVKKEKVGPIETEYSESIAASSGLNPDMPIVDAFLELLLEYGGGFTLTTYRK